MKCILSVFVLIAFIGCHPKSENLSKKEVSSGSSSPTLIPKVTGIGGIFFFSDNPDAIKQWYGENLGLSIDDYGSPFEFRNANNPHERNYLRWAPFEKGDDYFNPSEKPFMINYRVQNINALIAQLETNGVKILDTLQVYEYGKFIHIMDIEGNKIELWEPKDSFFTKLGGETTK